MLIIIRVSIQHKIATRKNINTRNINQFTTSMMCIIEIGVRNDRNSTDRVCDRRIHVICRSTPRRIMIHSDKGVIQWVRRMRIGRALSRVYGFALETKAHRNRISFLSDYIPG